MTPTVDMDSILAKAEWEQWRAKQSDPERIAAAARAWCTSSYWKNHTPRLEVWKIVVNDLGMAIFTDAVLSEMAEMNDHRLPFPPIPLFENEQVQDLCRIMLNADTAVALAERLEESNSLLTVDPSEAPQQCWDFLSAPARRGIDFAAWQWLFSGRESQVPLPSQPGVAWLTSIKSPRRAEALQRLEEAYRGRVTVVVEPEGDPAPAVDTESVARRERNQRLARELFTGYPDLDVWKQVREDACARQPESSAGPHPLAEMTEYLRGHEFSVALDNDAWKRLAYVFREHPRLLEIDRANPASPLPALELACSVRSTMTPGNVALGLLPFAGACKRSESWWKAVRLALRPMPRRDGFHSANDRWLTAIQALKLHARDLDPIEQAAMNIGLFPAGTWGRSGDGQR